MIIPGRNLIIKAAGFAIAGTKSCTINVDCDTIEKARHNVSNWREFTQGLKSWRVTTNQLVACYSKPAHVIEAVGTCHDGVNMSPSYFIIDGVRYAGGTRGLNMCIFRLNSQTGVYEIVENITYDTYGDPNIGQDMIQDMTLDIAQYDLVVVTSFDAYMLNNDIKAEFVSIFGNGAKEIPEVAAGRKSFCFIGIAGSGCSTVSNELEGSTSNTRLFVINEGYVMQNTPIKDLLTKAGTQLSITVQVDGFANDRLNGNVIVDNVKVTGTVGNLSQGSFSFLGNGPLT